MVEAGRIKYAHETVELVWGKHHQARNLAHRFEKLVTNPIFTRHLSGLRAFRNGFDPIPNRDTYEDFLRTVGHDFAAIQALPTGNVLRNLFVSGVVRENYLALHGVVTARLMVLPGALSRRQIVAIYDTLDRILRGGADWPSITKVPAVTVRDYQSLRRVRDKHNPSTTLHEVTVAAGTPDLGRDFGQLCMVHFAAIVFITMAVARKNGRSRVTVDDGFEAAEAYLKLFEIDPLELPPLIREGRSGYEV